MKKVERYQRVPVLPYPEREWPDKEIQKAPVWVSVDLRDGNQALVDPMVVSEKLEMWNLLMKLGFKEVEVGFPAASQIEFDFIRKLNGGAGGVAADKGRSDDCEPSVYG